MPTAKNNKQSWHKFERQDISRTIDSNSILSAAIAIKWQGYDCLFTDWHFFPAINLSRDLVPAEILAELKGRTAGEQIQYEFDARELIPMPQAGMQKVMPRQSFEAPANGQKALEPYLGRFYPKDCFRNISGINWDNHFLCRVTDLNNKWMTVDFNHPLAGKKITILFRIESIKKSGTENVGRCIDIVSQLCDMGPGMQDRQRSQETDFFSIGPFQRIDNNNDNLYFREARLTPYWDRNALDQVSRFYRSHIPEGSSILDLMAGVHSPLQEADIDGIQVTAAGLNAQELNNNKSCTRPIVLDVNRISALPFEDAEFGVVLIHAAIEYVIHPHLLFKEISRVLKPGGNIIVSFSDRNEAHKVIQLWTELHEFERTGLVLSYLRSADNLGQFQSFSCRGLSRPEDDPLADQFPYSDPVFIVLGQKVEAIN